MTTSSSILSGTGRLLPLLSVLLWVAPCANLHPPLTRGDDGQFELQGGTLLHYEGRLAPDGSQDAGQAIDWYVLAVPPGHSAVSRRYDWLWVVEEAGRGGWDWSRRFGRDTQQTPAPATLSFEHDTRDYIVPLVPWKFDVAQWAAGFQWEEDRGHVIHQVVELVQQNGHTCWKVVARTPIGVKRTLWVERASGCLVELQELVFMGRGEKFALSLKLAGSTIVDDQIVSDAWRAATSLDRLRQLLGQRQDAGSVPWSADQLARLRAFPLPDNVAWAPLRRLLQDVSRDRRQQSAQSNALESLAQQAVGRDVRQLRFRDDKGQELTFEALAKPVTVLHFWEYRDSPLQPPYGQVGFLDFLSRKRDTKHVAVVGVVVHRPTESDSTRRGVVRSAAKLTQFMNLSYPLVYDDGTAIGEIGDPRRLGVSLPLYVVVGPSGNIASVHAGLYPADPKTGLAQLEADIAKAKQNQNTGNQ